MMHHQTLQDAKCIATLMVGDSVCEPNYCKITIVIGHVGRGDTGDGTWGHIEWDMVT